MNEHRVSGYKRVERDAYQTIERWPVDALCFSYPLPPRIWEPAAGDGHMVRSLEANGFEVYATDIAQGKDFLSYRGVDLGNFGIVSNPPFGERGKLAEQFIVRALVLSPTIVAMLLPSDFDHAASRQPLFRHRAFAARINLTSRPRWFDGDATPKANFCWFVWDHDNRARPIVTYAGK